MNKQPDKPPVDIASLPPAEGSAKPSDSEFSAIDQHIMKLETELRARQNCIKIVNAAGGYSELLQLTFTLAGRIAGLRESLTFLHPAEGSAQPSEASSPDV